ncbi:MAG: hypothetical protein MN733_37410, partial [Nitrososphaera sp.]|nr:hypothetical protein [Nitrososphaera sp.]
GRNRCGRSHYPRSEQSRNLTPSAVGWAQAGARDPNGVVSGRGRRVSSEEKGSGPMKRTRQSGRIADTYHGRAKENPHHPEPSADPPHERRGVRSRLLRATMLLALFQFDCPGSAIH